MLRPELTFGPGRQGVGTYLLAGGLALFNVLILGLALTSDSHGAQLFAPVPAGLPDPLVEVSRLLIASASLAAIYEFDARVGGSSPRLMRIATEIGVISTAIMIVSSVLTFRWGLTPGGPVPMPEGVAWIAQTLGLAAMPGLGFWAVLAVCFGCPSATLPAWCRFAAGELAVIGIAAFLLPELANIFVAVLFTLWVGLGAFFGRAGETASERLERAAPIA